MIDLIEYRLEHITADDLNEQVEIVQRLATVKPDIFWLLRHVKDSKKNVLLLTLPDNEKIKVFSYFLLTGKKAQDEMLVTLNANVEYFETMEVAIHGFREVFNKINDINPSVDEMFDKCSICGGIQVFKGIDFCMDCAKYIDRCKDCNELISEDGTCCCAIDEDNPVVSGVDYAKEGTESYSPKIEGDGVNTCVKCGKGLENGLCKEHDSMMELTSEQEDFISTPTDHRDPPEDEEKESE